MPYSTWTNCLIYFCCDNNNGDTMETFDDQIIQMVFFLNWHNDLQYLDNTTEYSRAPLINL